MMRHWDLMFAQIEEIIVESSASTAEHRPRRVL